MEPRLTVLEIVSKFAFLASCKVWESHVSRML
jgi:hypothetical protein